MSGMGAADFYWNLLSISLEAFEAEDSSNRLQKNEDTFFKMSFVHWKKSPQSIQGIELAFSHITNKITFVSW